MEWVTWINTGVGIIGIVVGIIGWKSLSTATKIKNTIKADKAATVQQAQVINNGLDSYAVIRLTRETTKEELQKAIADLQPLVWEDLDDVSEKVNATNEQVKELTERVDKMPNIHVGKEPPEHLKDGDIWLSIE
ncbi:hypothetical protein [Evtepia gabavorous]|uniref:hypothetical protein n=1 Tax=Evtepia gabavorous TaxID=2211183 RepID=UPI003A8D8873